MVVVVGGFLALFFRGFNPTGRTGAELFINYHKKNIQLAFMYTHDWLNIKSEENSEGCLTQMQNKNIFCLNITSNAFVSPPIPDTVTHTRNPNYYVS